MDPISIMTAAAAAFGSSALGELAKKSVEDAWDGVKRSLQHAFGSSSELPALMDNLKAAPMAPEAQPVVARLANARLTEYPEVSAALSQLSEVLARHGVHIQATQTGPSNVYVEKLYGGAAVNHGSMHVSMTFNRDE